MILPKRESMKFLKRASKLKEFASIRDRIRAIILARKGMISKEIASKLDFTDRWVQKWVARYRKSGFDGLQDEPRSGAPKLLPADQEEAFIDRIFEGPKTEDKISIFHGHHIQKILKEEFGVTYSGSGVYALLERLKLSWITSRPRHEFNDPEKMEAWKKAFKEELKEIKKNSPTKKFKCGFKMKQGMDNMETSIESGPRRDYAFGQLNNKGSSLPTY